LQTGFTNTLPYGIVYVIGGFKMKNTEDIKDSRRTCKVPVRFLVHNGNEISLDEGWTAEYAGQFIEGVIITIDIHGFVIATSPDSAPIIGDKVTAVFKLHGIEQKIQIDGDVVWVNKYSPHYPKGFAVKYTNLSIKIKDLRTGMDNSYEPTIISSRGSDIMAIPD